MAKKKPASANNNTNRPQQMSTSKQVPTGQGKTTTAGTTSQKYLQPLLLAGLALVTYLAYKGSLENQFTNWDDLGYVLTNPLIKDSSFEGFKRIFDTANQVMGNYHPFTIVTYWFEYGRYGLEPWIYHLDSLIFHILATFTAFAFVKTLTKNTTAAAIAALLFAIHPMRVESVTWIAGRKDILYTIFYLLACITHIKFVRATKSKKPLFLVATILLFASSLLCKSVGVTLPVVLFFIDYYEKRKFDVYIFIEKIPLFLLSVAFGLLSIGAQKGVGAMGTLDVNYNFIEHVALGCYALCAYVGKMFIPIGLTNFYPYPSPVNGSLPISYYVYPLLVVGILFALIKYGLKNRLLVLGVSFFVINLLLLLQILVTVGGAVMSDRYTYIPYLGLFMIAGHFIAKLIEEKKPLGKTLLYVVFAASGVYAYMTSERNKDWYDSISLWNDAIEKNPESPIGYFYLGQDYYTRFEAALTQQERQKFGDSAYYYFQQSVAHKPDYTSPIICIGEYLRSTGRIDEAKTTYKQALAIKDDLESAYLGLAVVYSIKGQYDSAAPNFRKALSLKEYFPEGLSNYANFLEIVGKTDSALIVYEKSIKQNPDAYIPYMNRGRIYMKLEKNDLAAKDYSNAILLKPENPDPYYMRAQCYAKLGNNVQAKNDADAAKRMGLVVDPVFYESLLSVSPGKN